MWKKPEDEVFDRKTAQGSAFDKMYFTDDELKQGGEINRRAEAGEITWDDAHNWWENTRAGYGYTGGENGHGYTKLGATKNKQPSYKSQYQNAMDLATLAVLNRKPFEYDPNTDPMYQQYADTYTRLGKRAMDDTIGKVSARTGGLASSYATTAATQANDNYMAELAARVPELRKLAHDMYLGEDNRQRQNLNLVLDLEATDYGRYRDAVGDSQWQQNFDHNAMVADRNFNYGVKRDQVTDQRNAEQWQYGVDQDAENKKINEQNDARQRVLQDIGTLGMSAADVDPKLLELSGYTQAELAAMEQFYKDNNAAANAKLASGTKPKVESEWELFKKSPMYGGVMDKIKSFTNKDDLVFYLGQMVDAGYMSEALAAELSDAYAPDQQSPTIEEQWEVVSNGGINWGWGIDNNAKVKDRNGKEYTLSELVDYFVNNGMTEKEAKAEVKKIQKELGI